MKTICVYAGTFCPPTFGHLRIVERAVKIFPQVVIVCSANPKKDNNWFSPDQCRRMWLTYRLPTNVLVETFDSFKEKNPNPSQIILLRGIRDENDFECEKAVILLNQKIGIDKYFYLISEEKYKQISSTKVRDLAAKMDFEHLAEYVSPLIISALLEKVLNINNLFMVVGKPGSGKSTFLKMMTEEDSRNIHINTDEFNQLLKPLLKKRFGSEDLVATALKQEDKLKAIIRKPWLSLLKDRLQKTPAKSNIFVEIPYGMQQDKLMFRFIGGKIIYVGCENSKTNEQRIIDRGTPNLVNFISRIPGRLKTLEMAKKYKLNLVCINTDCSLPELKEKARNLNQSIQRGGLNL